MLIQYVNKNKSRKYIYICRRRKTIKKIIVNTLDNQRPLADSFIASSHNIHTRTGVNQSRSGTALLLGEHFSQTPSPQFRLQNRNNL